MSDYARIRRALLGDFEAIQHLLVALADGFRIPAPPDEARSVFEQQLEDLSADIFVAEKVGSRENVLVGVITVRYFTTINLGGTQAYIVELSVHPDHRRQGLGRALLNAAIDQARLRGCRLVEVKTHPKREAALGLYSASGMDETCKVLELPLVPEARLAITFDQ